MNRAVVIALAVVVGLAALASLIAWRVHAHLAGIRQEREREEALKLNSTELAHCGPVSCLLFSQDGKYLLAGSEGASDTPVPHWQGALFMWNVKTLQREAKIVLDQRVRDMAFDSKGKILAVSSSNVNWHSPEGNPGFRAMPGEVIFYTFPGLKETNRITIDAPVAQINWSRKERFFAVGQISPKGDMNQAQILIYDGKTFDLVATLDQLKCGNTSFVFSPDEKTLYVIQREKTRDEQMQLYAYDTETWKGHRLEHAGGLSSGGSGRLDLAPNDSWIVFTPGGHSGRCELVDCVAHVRVLSPHLADYRGRNFEVLSRFSDDMQHILQTTNLGGQRPTGVSAIYLVKQQTGQSVKLREVRQSYYSARAFSPDNNTFAVGVHGAVHRQGGGVILYHGKDLADYFTEVP